MKIKSQVFRFELIHFLTIVKEINLEIIGLMIIPPVNDDPKKFLN